MTISNGAAFRFVAFSTITGQPQAYAATAEEALMIATKHLPDADFIEVLDCGDNGKKIWTGSSLPISPVLLYKARKLHRTVFRGPGYATSHHPLPAISMIASSKMEG